MAWAKLRKQTGIAPIKYNEIPIMVSQSGKLVCIEIKRDMPSIGICGIKRSGKSLKLHALLDTTYHLRPNDCFCLLNDPHNESPTYSMKIKKAINGKPYGEKFSKQIETIGLQPKPLPMVHCYPGISAEETLTEIPPNISKINMSIRPEKIFESEELFTDNIGKSITYLRLIKETLKKCKSQNCMENTIDMEIPNGRGMESVKEKLNAIIENIFKEKIISFESDIISEATTTKNNIGTMPIIPLLMATRCIPAIMTNTLQSKPYFSTYLKLIVEEIFTIQKKGYFNQHQLNTWIFIDELIGIDSTKQKTNASTILQRLVTEGGPARIATIWASQIYSEVRDGIRKNTKYLISFRTNSNKDINAIMNDFDLTPSQADTIKNLNKDYFECVAISADEHFILYDLQTGKRTRYSGFIQGYSIPPLSFHKPPEFIMPTDINMRYAVKHLQTNKTEITANNKTILDIKETTSLIGTIDHPGYEELEQPQFTPGEPDITLYAPKTKKIIAITYEELKSYGFEIFSYLPTQTVFKGQRISYGIRKIGKSYSLKTTIMTYCPKDVIIELNPFERKIRIRSPNIIGGITKWREIDNEG